MTTTVVTTSRQLRNAVVVFGASAVDETTAPVFPFKNVSYNMYQVGMIERPTAAGKSAPLSASLGTTFATLSGEMELVAAKNAADYVGGPILQACGFTLAAHAFTHSDVHLTGGTPTGGGTVPVFGLVNVDGLTVGKIANAVGNATISFVANQIPTVAFDLTGQSGGYAPTVTPEVGMSGTWATYLVGSALGDLGLQMTAYFGGALKVLAELSLESFVYNTNNSILLPPNLNDIGYAPPLLTDKAPTFHIRCRIPTYATVPFEGLFANRTRCDFAFSHETSEQLDSGITGAATILDLITVGVSGVLSRKPTFVEVSNELQYDLDFDLCVDSANANYSPTSPLPFSMTWAA
jgi:hypothetical protein